jgi:hypothetical protein
LPCVEGAKMVPVTLAVQRQAAANLNEQKALKKCCYR